MRNINGHHLIVPAIIAACTACAVGLTACGDRATGAQRGRAHLAEERPSPRQPDDRRGGIAVLELFTSEGCSSCPSADRLFSKLVREFEGAGVFPLAFHVDYWNRLGWRDRFSRGDYSERQRRYSAALGTDGPYTPELVVNGTTEMVGSDEHAVRSAIDDALNTAPPIAVTIARVEWRADGTLGVRFSADGGEDRSVANVAVVERGLETQVGSGENGGRTLHHDNVVRAFAQAPAGAGAQGVAMTIPADLRAESANVIVYVQSPTTQRINGAAAAPLPRR